MQITIRVTPVEGDTYEVKTSLFVIVAFERKFKIRASELANGVGMEHLAFMAYESCKQNNIAVPVSFDEYIKRIAEIDVVADEPANPTNEAPTSDH
jgi:hypothetical protein